MIKNWTISLSIYLFIAWIYQHFSYNSLRLLMKISGYKQIEKYIFLTTWRYTHTQIFYTHKIYPFR